MNDGPWLVVIEALVAFLIGCGFGYYTGYKDGRRR